MQARNEVVQAHYQENFNRLCKYMRFRSGTEWNAEDIVQEAYHNALKYYENYDESQPFQAWFNKILINALVDFKRKEKGNMAEEFEEEHSEGFACTHYTDHVLKQIYERIDAKEEEHHQDILFLHFKHGYSPKDIAAITGNSPHASHKVIQRFRNELKELYGTKL